jgi:hypothetical protein
MSRRDILCCMAVPVSDELCHFSPFRLPMAT